MRNVIDINRFWLNGQKECFVGHFVLLESHSQLEHGSFELCNGKLHRYLLNISPIQLGRPYRRCIRHRTNLCVDIRYAFFSLQRKLRINSSSVVLIKHRKIWSDTLLNSAMPSKPVTITCLWLCSDPDKELYIYDPASEPDSSRNSWLSHESHRYQYKQYCHDAMRRMLNFY